MRPTDFWLSVTEAADRSGWSAQRVRVHIRKGQVIALKRYGHWLVNTRSFQDYLHQADQSTDTEPHAVSG